jgi:hypothetical protein
MGGMFSVVKVRDDLQRGDFRDPGPYRHPPGTLAHEFNGELGAAVRAPSAPPDGGTLQVRKPQGHAGH